MNQRQPDRRTLLLLSAACFALFIVGALILWKAGS